VLWSGAEYRGRGRETVWTGRADISGNRIEKVAAINFLNAERPLQASPDQGHVSWKSVTTGNMAGFDLWLEKPNAGRLTVHTNLAALDVDLASLGGEETIAEAGGLARRLRVWRLPDEKRTMKMHVTHQVIGKPLTRDLPVYVRITQEDGHQAWSSPIYLIP
jgi:hypothetical protein